MHQRPKSIARHALFVSATWVALSAHAQTPLRELAYEAPASCPTRSEFEQKLRARVPDASLPLGLAVRLTNTGAHTIGELRIEHGAQHGSERRVEAARCDEAVDALTLVIALLVEPPASRPTRPVQDGSARPARAGSETSAASRPTEPLAGPANVRAVSGEPGARSEPAPPEDRSSPLRSPVPSERDRYERTVPPVRFGLAASGLLAFGALPAPRPGFSARVGVDFVLRELALGVELGARGLFAHVERSDQGSARFGLWTASAALCARRGTWLRGSLCASGELGALTARGEATTQPADARVLWSALGPTLRMRLAVFGPLALESGVELAFALARDRFTLGASELFRVSPLTVRGELGLAVELE